MEQKTLWFRAKKYGYGWYPITWQGWVCTIVYVLLVLACALTLNKDSGASGVTLYFALPIIVFTIIFFIIARKKGEVPHWSWGDKK